MVAVCPEQIAKIDAFARDILHIPTAILMERAGAAVAKEVMHLCKKGSRVLVFCGSGNNGGDGYAAGKLLLENGYSVHAVDVFGKGQRTEEGRAAYKAFCQADGFSLSFGVADAEGRLRECDIVIEAVFGVGARQDYPQEAVKLLADFARARQENIQSPLFVAVDCPLGTDALLGTARDDAFVFDATVELTLPKIGLHSYPARRYAGTFSLHSLELPIDVIIENFNLQNNLTDDEYVKDKLPKRISEGHKGSFGALGVLCGSDAYPGAALLACEGAMRTGVGMLHYFGSREVMRLLLTRRPEAVCHPMPPIADMTAEDAVAFVTQAPEMSAWLIGCGCGRSEGLAHLLRAFLTTEGAPLILDADALNTLADSAYSLMPLLAKCKRLVALTPHPLEFSRLFAHQVSEVQANRLGMAREASCLHGVTLLLKGSGTVISSPSGQVTVNTSGNTALAKGGSGDVLAGVIAGFAAQGAALDDACELGAYLHGLAGERLSAELGEAGVLPSDLPIVIAKEMKRLSQMN